MKGAPVLLAGLLLCGCSKAPPPSPVPAPVPSRIASGPPTAKEAIALVFRNGDVRLDSDPSCSGVGTTRTDATIGDFLAGFLAEQAGEGSGKNWIDASCADAKGDRGAGGWECRVMVRRVDGEERWGWGVRFFVRASDRAAVRPSFRCVGAG